MLSASRPAASAPSLKFGYTVGFDVGASKATGTGKVAVFDRGWNKVGGTTQPQELCPGGAASFESFVSGIAGLAKNILKSAKAALKGDNKADAMIFFVPGQPDLDGRVPYLSNLRTVDGQSVTDLRLDQVPDKLGIAKSKDFRLIAMNDMGGGIAAALARLKEQHPDKFKPGMDMIYMMTGGGFGFGEARYSSDGSGKPGTGEVHLQLTELGNIPYPAAPLGKDGIPPSLEEAGGSLRALLDNFTDNLPARYTSAQQEAIKAAGNGKVVTSYTDAQAMLPDLTEAEYTQAAKFSVDRYIDALAYVTGIKIYSGTNLAVIAGGIAGGIKRFVDEHQDLFARELADFQNIPGTDSQKDDCFDKVFVSRVWHQLKPVAKSQFVKNGFDVVSDIKLPDNTDGTPYIAKGRFADRGDHYIIPASAFEGN